MTVEERKNLDEREQVRVDGLLSSARTFHYLNFVVAGTSLAFSSLDKVQGLKLPIGDVFLPRIQAAVGAYILSIALAIISDRFFRMATPWMGSDPRRPSFAWFPLGLKQTSFLVVSLWLLVPVLITAIAASITLAGDIKGYGLLLPGFLLAGWPRIIERYIPHILNRTDIRGGLATFSIWLLYWIRIVRSFLLNLAFLFPVIAAVPKWRVAMLQLATVVMFPFGVVWVVRILGGFIYPWIDRVGTRFGFPGQSDHYSTSK